MTRRDAALATALLLAAAGCAGDLVRTGTLPSATPGRPRSLGSGVVIEGSSGEGSGARATATPASVGPIFVLRLVDQNDRHPPGITVEIDGVRSLSLVSDRSGEVVVDAPPGSYTYEVTAGCGERIEVLRGARGRFGIAEDAGGRGEVRIEWRHRVVPYPVVVGSVGPDWPVGEDVRLRYDVIERCPERDRARDRAFDTFTFRTGANVEVVGAPRMRSDDDGFGHVTVRCTAPGEASVVLQDSLNPSDRIDLAAQAGRPGQPSRCI